MDFEKEQIIFDLDSHEKKLQLVQSILQTQNDLDKAHKNFEYAENGLVDFYIYQIKALSSKLDYLTKIAKIKNIQIDLSHKKAV